MLRTPASISPRSVWWSILPAPWRASIVD